MGETYHVVCHECSLEELLEAAAAAETLQADHQASTGHRVSCEAIAPEISEV